MSFLKNISLDKIAEDVGDFQPQKFWSLENYQSTSQIQREIVNIPRTMALRRLALHEITFITFLIRMLLVLRSVAKVSGILPSMFC